ncbi:Xyloglucan endotransglucosylase/hydrolase protein 2 [Striga hermonthica]|uniref:Xyloglucan endotransglucosylase/hydrolase n=1 Tax=Striga hermonthica TaxID=68872 RepID=A0A9N7NA71_STRHE|nr:Xyloglucan endotransglucosylase/hydrolase protein 2 [Striga hermonthica]
MTFHIVFPILLCSFALPQANAYAIDNNFNTYYSYLWGGDHFTVNPQGTLAQLKFDSATGAGFKSKSDYGSGLFHMKMKIPANRTQGVITSFYLTEVQVGQSAYENHFEVDFEFIGTDGSVSTNIFANDKGYREQVFKLWFNPSQDFHSYDILWNSHQIVFIVDNIPLRVFKNNAAQGVAFPSSPMHIEASIWHADWAGQVDWSGSPFIASYSDFGFYACAGDDMSKCGSPRYFWNGPKYLELNAAQKQQMAEYRRKYMIYDYCTNPNLRKKECDWN